MSYILDALRKSEAELDPAVAANLALNQQRNQSRQRLTGILVAAALMANVAVLLWLFGPDELTPPAAGVATAALAPNTVVAPATATPPTAIGSGERVAAPAIATAVAPVRTAQISARLADLPTAVRGRFPGLAFSTHIYAEDPALRAVVANGTRLVEGDEIDGAAVERITEDGIVLAFENYLVEISVVAEWE